jgi:hypothetical protein
MHTTKILFVYSSNISLAYNMKKFKRTSLSVNKGFLFWKKIIPLCLCFSAKLLITTEHDKVLFFYFFLLPFGLFFFFLSSNSEKSNKTLLCSMAVHAVNEGHSGLIQYPNPTFYIYVYKNAALRGVLTNNVALLWVEVVQPWSTLWFVEHRHDLKLCKEAPRCFKPSCFISDLLLHLPFRYSGLNYVLLISSPQVLIFLPRALSFHLLP